MKSSVLAAIAISVLAIAIIAALVLMGSGDKLQSAEDPDKKLGMFCFVIDGKETDIVKGMDLPKDLKVTARDGTMAWRSCEVNEGSGIVALDAVVDDALVDYVFVFEGMKPGSLSAGLNKGVPEIHLAVDGGLRIALYYYDHKGEDMEKFTFGTYEHLKQTNVQLVTYYSDTLLDGDPTKLNPDLMAFACALEISSGYEATERYTSVLKLLEDIGCSKVKANDSFHREPRVDSTDVAVGYKKYNDQNVIFVVLNGTRYNTEFTANLMVGETGDHKGFCYARDEGMNALKDFIRENGITGKTKLLITGYSRTAAGGNLLAASIADMIHDGTVRQNLGDIELEQKDFFAFSFETPLCGYYEEGKGYVKPTDPRYDGIWYVTDPNDVVTYVPSDLYGFVRYGQHYVTKSHDADATAKMLEAARKYYGDDLAEMLDLSKYTVISDVGSLQELWEGFVPKMFNSLGTRQFYHDNMERDITRSTEAVLKDPSVIKEITDRYGGVMAFIVDLYGKATDKETFTVNFLPVVSEIMTKHGMGEYSQNLVDASYQLVQMVKRYSGGSVMSLITDKYVLSMTANTNYLITSHMPSMVYSYLMAESGYY